MFSDRELFGEYEITLESYFSCTRPVAHVPELEVCRVSTVDIIWNEIYARCENSLTVSLRPKSVIYLCICNHLNV